jgi:phosphopantetheinyl transferase
MPMVFKKEEDTCCTGLWEITEQASFFESMLSFRATATHPEKIRLQLAARMILHDFDNDFPFDNVEIAAGGKPVLKNQGIRFSLSHCNGFAAAIVSDKAEVGIDIEPIHQRVLKIEKKFLHATELRQLDLFNQDDRIKYATLYWTLKETLYKWWGKGSVDFSNEMIVNTFDANQIGCAQMTFSKLPDAHFELNYFLHEHIWVTTLCK